ncbi:MAG: RNA methyltransferase [Alphaproteobacteria bacterium]|nr:RNA methyltransferase [Alphaproteobacteria bacterium]
MAGTDRTKQQTVVEAHSGPAVILVAPQLGENVGTAARAMLNFGLTDLRLVRPRDGWPNAYAVKASSGAFDQIRTVRLFDRTEDAIADLDRVYATTARRRDLIKPTVTPQTAMSEARGIEESGARVGVLFGGERSGLNNDDVTLAHSILTVPVNPSFASINLAQAVLLLGYEYFRQTQEAEPRIEATQDQEMAPTGEIVGFFEQLERELDTHNFLYPPEKRPAMVRNIRNLFQRANLTLQEVRTLRGIVTALVRPPRERVPYKERPNKGKAGKAERTKSDDAS